MLVLVFRKKNSGVDVDLGFSLRQQPSVDPTRSRSECIGGHCFIFISPKGAKNNDNVLSFSILLIITLVLQTVKLTGLESDGRLR